nr:glycosyltransferase family 2 protein [Rhabdothermincola salaria]
MLAIVPALNEEATVGDVVKAIIGDLEADVLVIDDGSSDRTALLARDAGAVVVRHPFNLGVGAALRTGFKYARRTGYPVVIQVDADGQHDTAGAHALVAAVVDGGVDLVVGSRFAEGYQVSGLRRLSMRALSRTVSRRLGVEITDTTSGFRAFSARAVDRFAASYPSQYLSDTVEALLLAHDDGLRIAEVPVRMRERMGGRASAGRIKSVFHLVRLMLVVSIHRFRRPALVGGGS